MSSGSGWSRYQPPTPISGYTDEELKRRMEVAAEVRAIEGLLPRELFILADTWRVDMLVQQEDRERDPQGRRRV
jgi:hypothetical protein